MNLYSKIVSRPMVCIARALFATVSEFLSNIFFLVFFCSSLFAVSLFVKDFHALPTEKLQCHYAGYVSVVHSNLKPFDDSRINTNTSKKLR